MIDGQCPIHPQPDEEQIRIRIRIWIRIRVRFARVESRFDFSGSIRTVQDLSFSMGSIMIHCDQSGPTEIDQDLTAINVAMIC